jgi:intracellular septation protein A
LANLVIANPTFIDLVQHVLTITMNVAIIVVQNKARSYTERVLGDDFIPLAIETYDCIHFHFDSFFIFCVHANIARH